MLARSDRGLLFAISDHIGRQASLNTSDEYVWLKQRVGMELGDYGNKHSMEDILKLLNEAEKAAE